MSESESVTAPKRFPKVSPRQKIPSCRSLSLYITKRAFCGDRSSN